MKFDITTVDLEKTAIERRLELLIMPMRGLGKSSEHMTVRTGIRYKETIGQLDGDIQIGPYNKTRIDGEEMAIIGRELEVFFGSAIKEFDPNDVVQSIYGDLATKGVELLQTNITRYVLAYLSKKAGKNLDKCLFSAVRNATKGETKDLFNGFDTITTMEIAAGTISVANENYMVLTENITSTNAVDMLKSVYENAHEELQGQPSKMFINRNIYNAYNKDYQSSNGALPYNTEYKKTFLEGTDDLCELVPMPNKKGSPYIHLTTKKNMTIGVNQDGEEEKITVEKHAAFTLQFIMTMFFGVQFETLSPEHLLVAKLNVV
jgi:hypothetical protein